MSVSTYRWYVWLSQDATCEARHTSPFSGNTSGRNLIGHASYDTPPLQDRAYNEMDNFVCEQRSDRSEEDKLSLISDHGFENGVHTNKAYVSSNHQEFVESVNPVPDFYGAVNVGFERTDHVPEKPDYDRHEGDNRKI